MPKTDIEWLEYANEFHYGNHPEINTAVKHAIEALRKQIPEHPVYAWCEETDDYGMTCPACHAKHFYTHNNYCWQCGQALIHKEQDAQSSDIAHQEKGSK